MSRENEGAAASGQSIAAAIEEQSAKSAGRNETTPVSRGKAEYSAFVMAIVKKNLRALEHRPEPPDGGWQPPAQGEG